MLRLPNELIDLILSFHRPICEQMFAGNPNYTLYWAYDKLRLKEMLGMTHGKYKLIRSRLGEFLRRVPETRFFCHTMEQGVRWVDPSRGPFFSQRSYVNVMSPVTLSSTLDMGGFKGGTCSP